MTVSDRVLPLFPLDQVVLYPGMSLPLRIFEERYKVMIGACQVTDQLFDVQRVAGRLVDQLVDELIRRLGSGPSCRCDQLRDRTTAVAFLNHHSSAIASSIASSRPMSGPSTTGDQTRMEPNCDCAEGAPAKRM